MDPIFNRLGNLLRSVFQEEEHSTAHGHTEWGDTDLHQAEEELDEFLRTGRTFSTEKTQNATNDTERKSRAKTQNTPESLREDYANLEIPFGTSFSEVKKVHKNLMRKYHPDRFHQDAQRQKTATEITARINASFQKIKEFEKKRL